MDMESGKKGREHVRTIQLLDSGIHVTIKVPEWERAGPQAFAKEFDESNTSILRVFKERNGAGFMVYGMKAAGDDVTEAYEVVALEGMVGNAADKIAAHCGLEDAFRKQVTV